MSLLRRMFSPSYRRAVLFEAGGDYLEAARAYALCGLRDKVAEMHLCEAERLDSDEARVQELRAAVRFVDDRSAGGRALLGRIGRSYINLLRRRAQSTRGGLLRVLSERDRELCREAAELAQRAAEPAAAAEALELAGDEAGAADAYRDAGELERMETLLAKEERRRQGQNEERDNFQRYRMHLLLGQRDQALAALRACLGAAERPEEAQRLLDDLNSRLLGRGRVVLRREGPAPPQTTIHVGSFPLLLGRGADCQLVLRDAGISRCHASIRTGPALPGATPTFTLRDLGSKNGTTLNHLSIAGELQLREEGQIGIGDHCDLAFAVSGAELHLRVSRGLDRGLLLCAAPVPVLLDDAGTELSFDAGRPLLTAPAGAAPLLNGQRARRTVQLILGDVVELPPFRYEVLP